MLEFAQLRGDAIHVVDNSTTLRNVIGIEDLRRNLFVVNDFVVYSIDEVLHVLLCCLRRTDSVLSSNLHLSPILSLDLLLVDLFFTLCNILDYLV